ARTQAPKDRWSFGCFPPQCLLLPDRQREQNHFECWQKCYPKLQMLELHLYGYHLNSGEYLFLAPQGYKSNFRGIPCNNSKVAMDTSARELWNNLIPQ